LNALHAAFDAGINFYDTAEGYGSGQSEQLLARGLGSQRKQIVIATKVSPNHFAEAEMRAACERSLQALGTDYIDLYQLHWPNHDIPIADTLDVLDKLKQEGKVRAFGVSNFGQRDLGDALGTGKPIASNQLAYSLLFRAIEDDILPLCRQHQVSVLTYSSLTQGLLSGKYMSAADVQPDRARTRHYSGTRPHARHGEEGQEQLTFDTIAQVRAIASEIGQPIADVALAWLIAQPGVTSVIAGARNVDQAHGIARAAELVLQRSDVERLNGVTDALKQQLGPNPDMWQHVSRMR
jgi:aryl-alcohol dehydrogenase-like predicted oxidoreductase